MNLHVVDLESLMASEFIPPTPKRNTKKLFMYPRLFPIS